MGKLDVKQTAGLIAELGELPIIYCTTCGAKTNMKLTGEIEGHHILTGEPIYRVSAVFRCPERLHRLFKTRAYTAILPQDKRWARCFELGWGVFSCG